MGVSRRHPPKPSSLTHRWFYARKKMSNFSQLYPIDLENSSITGTKRGVPASQRSNVCSYGERNCHTFLSVYFFSIRDIHRRVFWSYGIFHFPHSHAPSTRSGQREVSIAINFYCSKWLRPSPGGFFLSYLYLPDGLEGGVLEWVQICFQCGVWREKKAFTLIEILFAFWIIIKVFEQF